MSRSRNMVFHRKRLSFHTQACGFFVAIYNHNLRKFISVKFNCLNLSLTFFIWPHILELKAKFMEPWILNLFRSSVSFTFVMVMVFYFPASKLGKFILDATLNAWAFASTCAFYSCIG